MSKKVENIKLRCRGEDGGSIAETPRLRRGDDVAKNRPRRFYGAASHCLQKLSEKIQIFYEKTIDKLTCL